MAKFFAIKNLVANCTTEVTEPWLLKTTAPYDLDKPAFREWSVSPTTEHVFLSMIEAVVGGLRVEAASNPPWTLHGLMIDYDGKLMDNPVEHVLKKAPAEFLPQWLVVTQGKKGRLVWLFEKPLRLYSADHFEKLMRHIFNVMKLDRWLAGIDTKAVTSATQYYELGRQWLPVRPDARIPSIIVNLWDSQVFHKVQRQGDGMMRVKIPMCEIKKEVDTRFPGRWTAEFAVGTRGPRFWDPAADNPTGICIMEDGCRVYTPHDKPFMPWVSIFGTEFVQRYEAERLSGLPDLCAYDGKDFWVSGTITGSKKWDRWGKDDFRKLLRERGFSDRRGKDSTSLLSDAEKLEIQVMVQHRVDAGLPFLFYPQGIITWNGSKYLNTTAVFPVEPSAPVSLDPLTWDEGRTKFPFIHRILSRLFVSAADAPEDAFASVRGDPDEQLMYFLSWLSHFYKSALSKHPTPGQALVIAGAPSKGKTILTQEILGRLMGGCVDGTPHLVEDDQWTEDIAKSPIVYVDDSVAANDLVAHKRFSARVKKYVANGAIRSNAKFKATGMVPWHGRILILCNEDSESLRILPDVEMSNKDKMSFLRAGSSLTGFGSQEDNQRKVGQELPAFARFLLDWDIPESLVDPRNRFGTVAYMHPTLVREASTQGSEAMFLEAWSKTVKELGDASTKEDWRFAGTATEIHELMASSAPTVMRELSNRALGRVLSSLVSHGYDVQVGSNKSHLRTYSVPAVLYAADKTGVQK